MAQATRTELVKRHQEQQVSTTDAKSKPTVKWETKAGEPAATGTNKTKPSYKHIPHSQKPPHLVAKRNARERRRVKAVNEAFNTLKKCVPIQNRNKRVSKVKTLQRAIDHIRHLQALLEADNEAAGTSANEHRRIFVSSKAGEEAEMRLAMSPEPVARRRATPATKVTKTSSSASQVRQQVEESPVQKQRRGRKPNAIKQQEASALKQRQQQQQQVNTSVLMEQQQQQQTDQHYLIEGQTNEYASVPHGATPPHYYSLPQGPCHTSSADARAPAYAYTNETPNQHQHYQSYENAAHYYQQSFHEQYQQPGYEAHFYSSAAGHQVPYGDADSTSAQRALQQQQPMATGWQPVQSSTGSSRSSGGAPVDSSLAQLSGSPASSASLTQLMCNLNTSNSSSECSSSGPNATASSCLYNGAVQQHHHHHHQQQQQQQQQRRRAMPADSTTPSMTSNKSASSLMDSPYSTASSSSVSSASNSFAVGAGSTSLDSSAPLNLKHADKSSPTSAGGRQVNNYANNYALPTFVYDPQRQQSNEANKLIGQPQQQRRRQKNDATHQTGFLCGGDSPSDLYLAEANNEHQQHQLAASQGPHEWLDLPKRHSALLVSQQQAHLNMADQLGANERANALYNAPTPL